MIEFRATALLREMFLRSIMMECIRLDAKDIKQLSSGRGDVWIQGLFEPLHKKLTDELIEIKRTLRRNAVFIVEEEWREFDIFVKYKENNIIKEAIFPMPMLAAEVQGRLKHILE
ncbi:hypothetical protein [Effusibacillus lacus]|uniref:Uncharacterized protein n=1 Tax=Effusibacillus lacus TaxID=1348429 RepID=A0A292YTZ4_9BACL|nr:hypothetical protein [Effusibacillus lacus]TCS73540.1 hypothetical protein EDD64_11847 [Effusibacillus lacus]GAX91965.1 hypothetical protein EFBL_3656 [Effusibacillus lacus]